MLSENIKVIRKSKGLSQEELAVKLNVVRQTISKWEQGLSVPDSEMLISLSKALEIPVSSLLGETVEESHVDDLKVISEKLEIINLQLLLYKEMKRKKLQMLFILLLIGIIGIFFILLVLDSPYLNWDYSNPEWAIVGVIFHGFEWIFIRLLPFALIGIVLGLYLTRKK